MKSKNLVPLLILFSLLSCGKHANNEAVDISVCGQQNPEWLISEIKRITNTTTSFRPVSVYLYIHEDMQYIALTDVVNSSESDAVKFYNCSGELIDNSSEKYQELKLSYERHLFKKLWSN